MDVYPLITCLKETTMTKKILLIAAVLLLCVLLTGCPCNCWMNLYQNIGKGIANLPEWSYAARPGESFSKWQDWAGSALSQLLPAKYNRQDYIGKYRLVMIGQNLGIEFDDGMAVVFLYVWLAKVTEDDHDSTDITIPQTTPDSFTFSGTAKFDFSDSSQDKTATVTMTKKSEDDKQFLFNYKLNIAETEMVNTDFTAMKEPYFTSNTVPSWLPDTFHKEPDTYNPKYVFQKPRIGEQDLVTTGFRCFSASTHGYDNLGQATANELFYHGGMKEISVDNATKKAVYRLFDGAPRAPQYVELHRDTEDTVLFTWFNLPEGQEDPTTNRIDPWEETLYVQK